VEVECITVITRTRDPKLLCNYITNEHVINT